MDKLVDCYVFDTQLHMVHLRVELDHFNILHNLQLDCVESSGYLRVVHI